MKKYFILFIIFFSIKIITNTGIVKAESIPTDPVFCTNAELSMVGGDCISTCRAIAASINSGTSLATYLNVGSEGFCTGQAEELQKTIYQIILKQEVGRAACPIFYNPSGWNISLAKSAGDETAPLNFVSTNSCPDTAIYDVIEIVFADLYRFSGSTVFPDSSSTVIRTSSDYSGLGGSGSADILSNWMEYICAGARCAFTNNALNYFAPTTTWNTAYKKTGTISNALTYSAPSSAVLHDESLTREMRINGSPYNREGYICESREFAGQEFEPATRDNTENFNSDICQNGGTLRVHYSADSSELFDSTGTFPIRVNKGDNVFVNFNFYGLRDEVANDPIKEMGVNFIFENVGGSLHLLGYRSAEDGMIIKVVNAGRISQ